MKTAYFARPITHYGTPQERIDIAIIELAGFECGDIKSDEVQERYKRDGMGAFRPIVEASDALFFLAFEDGMIGKGVAREIEWAGEMGIPIFELPNNIDERTLSVDETRTRVRGAQIRSQNVEEDKFDTNSDNIDIV